MPSAAKESTKTIVKAWLKHMSFISIYLLLSSFISFFYYFRNLSLLLNIGFQPSTFPMSLVLPPPGEGWGEASFYLGWGGASFYLGWGEASFPHFLRNIRSLSSVVSTKALYSSDSGLKGLWFSAALMGCHSLTKFLASSLRK